MRFEVVQLNSALVIVTPSMMTFPTTENSGPLDTPETSSVPLPSTTITAPTCDVSWTVCGPTMYVLPTMRMIRRVSVLNPTARGIVAQG